MKEKKSWVDNQHMYKHVHTNTTFWNGNAIEDETITGMQ
jgi:hypothetical protein